jgi:hypothetical protein
LTVIGEQRRNAAASSGVTKYSGTSRDEFMTSIKRIRPEENALSFRVLEDEGTALLMQERYSKASCIPWKLILLARKYGKAKAVSRFRVEGASLGAQWFLIARDSEDVEGLERESYLFIDTGLFRATYRWS